LLHIVGRDKIYQEFPGYDIIEREGLDDVLEMIKDVYDGDSILDPRQKSSCDPPPVSRVHAIYGVNLPTEIGSVYMRKDACFSESKLKNFYKPDTKATLGDKNKTGEYTVKGGILMETNRTPQTAAGGRKVSGDGTVPYWSLQHCKTWMGPNIDVTVVEIDQAEHREILADVRFHKALLDYCRIQKKSV
jgi:hypothetical protein